MRIRNEGRPFFARLLSGLLMLGMALPSPAWALRPANVSQSTGLEELKDALQPSQSSAGLEEVRLEPLTPETIRESGERLRELIEQVPMNPLIRQAVAERGGAPDISIWDPRLSFVARDRSGEIVGVAAAYPREEEGDVYLAWLVMTPEARGQGMGRRLFDAVLAAAAGLGKEKLQWEVLVRNVEARRFYDRLNARVVGRTPSPLGLADALVFELPTAAGTSAGLEEQQEDARVLDALAAAVVSQARGLREFPSYPGPDQETQINRLRRDVYLGQLELLGRARLLRRVLYIANGLDFYPAIHAEKMLAVDFKVDQPSMESSANVVEERFGAVVPDLPSVLERIRQIKARMESDTGRREIREFLQEAHAAGPATIFLKGYEWVGPDRDEKFWGVVEPHLQSGDAVILFSGASSTLERALRQRGYTDGLPASTMEVLSGLSDELASRRRTPYVFISGFEFRLAEPFRVLIKPAAAGLEEGNAAELFGEIDDLTEHQNPAAEFMTAKEVMDLGRIRQNSSISKLVRAPGRSDPGPAVLPEVVLQRARGLMEAAHQRAERFREGERSAELLPQLARMLVLQGLSLEFRAYPDITQDRLLQFAKKQGIRVRRGKISPDTRADLRERLQSQLRHHDLRGLDTSDAAFERAFTTLEETIRRAPAAGLEEGEMDPNRPRRLVFDVHPGQSNAVQVTLRTDAGEEILPVQVRVQKGQVEIASLPSESRMFITLRRRSVEVGGFHFTPYKVREILPLVRTGRSTRWRPIGDEVYFFPLELIDQLLAKETDPVESPTKWRAAAPYVFSGLGQNAQGVHRVELRYRAPSPAVSAESEALRQAVRGPADSTVPTPSSSAAGPSTGLEEKIDIPTVFPALGVGERLALEDVWRQVARVGNGDWEAIRAMPFEEFAGKMGAVSVDWPAGPEVIPIMYVSERGYRGIQADRRSIELARGRMRYMPPELARALDPKWWEAPEITGEGVYWFPEEMKRYRASLGRAVSKNAVFHEFMERFLVRHGIEDKNFQVLGHTTPAVILGDLMFAARMGEGAFERAVADHRASLDLIQAALNLADNSGFPEARRREEELLGVDRRVYEKWGEALWDRVSRRQRVEDFVRQARGEFLGAEGRLPLGAGVSRHLSGNAASSGGVIVRLPPVFSGAAGSSVFAQEQIIAQISPGVRDSVPLIGLPGERVAGDSGAHAVAILLREGQASGGPDGRDLVLLERHADFPADAGTWETALAAEGIAAGSRPRIVAVDAWEADGLTAQVLGWLRTDPSLADFMDLTLAEMVRDEQGDWYAVAVWA